MDDLTETCRYCGALIGFTRIGDDWDWRANLGTSVCASTDSSSGRHYPVNPVEGIDY